jgi:hypothetical protein
LVYQVENRSEKRQANCSAKMTFRYEKDQRPILLLYFLEYFRGNEDFLQVTRDSDDQNQERQAELGEMCSALLIEGTQLLRIM